MKRVIILLCLIFSASSFTFAQKFHFGLKAAPGLAWLKSDTKGVDGNGSKVGFSYGIVTEFAFNAAENYAFATGLEVAYRGGKISSSTIDTATLKEISVKEKINLQYIEIPFTLKMKTNEIGAVKYFGQVGVAPAINIKSQIKTTIGSTTVEDDFKDGTNSFNMSFVIALGMEYNLVGTTSGFVSVGFNNGLLDITKAKGEKVISNLLSLNVGVLF